VRIPYIPRKFARVRPVGPAPMIMTSACWLLVSPMLVDVSLLMVRSCCAWSGRCRGRDTESGEPFGDRPVERQIDPVGALSGQRRVGGNPGTHLVRRVSTVGHEPVVGLPGHRRHVAVGEAVEHVPVPFWIEALKRTATRRELPGRGGGV